MNKFRTYVNQKSNNVQYHLQEYKIVYISGTICLVSGIFIGVILKKQPVLPTQIFNTVAPIFNNSSNVNFGGYSHKLVKNNETGQIWETIKDAATFAAVTPSKMSRHLNGHMGHINNETYSIIGVGTSG